MLRELARVEDRLRRVDLVDDAPCTAFYDERVGDRVVSGRHFDQWWKRARADDPDLLTLTPEALLGANAAEALGPRDSGGVAAGRPRARGDLPVRPRRGRRRGHRARAARGAEPRPHDGFDWQVPGLRDELVAALVKTLPKDVRRDLQPVAATTAAAIERLDPAHGPMADALATALGEVAPVRIDGRAFDPGRVPEHLRIGFVVEDDGREVARGRDLDALRTALSARVRAAIAA